MAIYIYVKTHNKTGLKYLGKTSSKDPHKYSGSGVIWKKHLKLHGHDYTTEIIKECNNKDEIKYWGEYYSNLWGVVEADSWANLKPENGDGGDTSMSENFRNSMKRVTEQKKKCKWWNNGISQVHSEFPPSKNYINGRLPFNNKGAEIGAAVNKNRYWITNDITEIMIDKSQDPPYGFKKGRIKNKAFGGKSSGYYIQGRHWWNNGVKEIMAISPPDSSFYRGRIKS